MPYQPSRTQLSLSNMADEVNIGITTGIHSPSKDSPKRRWSLRNSHSSATRIQHEEVLHGNLYPSDIQDLMRWDFDITQHTNETKQIDDLMTMFHHTQTLAILDLQLEEFESFLHDVRFGYTCDSGFPFRRHYHSFLHALDVTQTLFAILQFSEDQHVLMNVEKVVLLIAALGHDIHHPGVSNHYIVVSKHQHVLEYGDTSVLERMHVAKMKHLIEKHKIFESLEDREKIRMNRILTNAILNTDVAQHDKLLQNVEDLLQHNTFVTLEEEMMTVNMDEKDRELLCNFLLHSADLSNPAKPWPIAQKWAHLIMMEFFEQGEAEKRNGYPVSPNCDAYSTNTADLQIQFINFAVIPCFTLLECFFPKASEALNLATENIGRWNQKKDTALTLEQRSLLRERTIDRRKSEWVRIQTQLSTAGITRKEHIWAKKILQNSWMIIFISLFAAYTLFESDLRHVIGTKSFDIVFQGLSSVVILLSAGEILLSHLADSQYFGSFYFWLDVACAIFFVLDQPFLWALSFKEQQNISQMTGNGVIGFLINGSSSTNGGTDGGDAITVNDSTAWSILYWLIDVAKKSRISRVVRVIRLLRFVHLTRLVNAARFRTADTLFYQDVLEDDSNLIFQRKDIKKIYARLCDKKTGLITSHGLKELIQEAYNEVEVPEHAIEHLGLYFEMPKKETGGITKEQFVTGLRKLEFKHDDSNLSVAFVTNSGSTSSPRLSLIGNELSDIITRRVLMLAFAILLFLPECTYTTNDMSKFYGYGLQQLHFLRLNPYNETTLASQLSIDLDIFMNQTKPLYLRLYQEGQQKNSPQVATIGNLEKILTTYREEEMHVLSVMGCQEPLQIYEFESLGWSSGLRWFQSNQCISIGIFDRSIFLQAQAEESLWMNVAVLFLLFSSVFFFDKETDRLVIKPINNMLNVVKQLANNPLGKVVPMLEDGTSIKSKKRSSRRRRKEDASEIVLLQKTLIKIASLIQIGFGEAGAEILAGNMLEGDLNPMVPGKKIHGIFGFCSILNFADATDALKEEIMTFTNRIGDIVHESVNHFGGHANKNIGQAFLLVWKIPKMSTDFALINGSQMPDHLSPKQEGDFYDALERARKSSAHRGRKMTVADRALISFLKIQLDIYHSRAFDEYREALTKPQSNTNNATNASKSAAKKRLVTLGFGLHVGWAIEGAIGSKHKVDASYLAPDVNMSSRLEAATRQFEVPILMSHQFYKLLSASVQGMCRQIDCVTVKGSEKPISLYTFDIVNYSPSIELRDTSDLMCLQQGISYEFRSNFDQAVMEYLNGDWKAAEKHLFKALFYKTEDGPSTTLLRIIREQQCVAPAEWKGYRKLTIK